MTEKTCTGCSRSLPLEEFHRSKSAKDGRQWRCKSCQRAWREQNHERDRENARRWHEQNREEVNERRLARREALPHEGWESDYRKRSRAAGCIPVVRSFTREELVAHWGNGERCLYCDGPFEEVDHLYPVSLGGVHAVETVVPCCSICNQAGGQHASRLLRQMGESARHLQVIVGAARARLAPIA